MFPLSTDVSVNGLTVDITWDKPTLDLEVMTIKLYNNTDIVCLFHVDTLSPFYHMEPLYKTFECHDKRNVLKNIIIIFCKQLLSLD